MGNLKYLKIFYLKDVNFISVNSKAFQGAAVDIIVTTDDNICCIAPIKTECVDKKPWYRSCSRMLKTKQISHAFISVSILIVIMNSCSMFLNTLGARSGKVFLLIVNLMNISELLPAVYFCILWIDDQTFKSSFMLKSEIWRTGPICFAAFGIMIWYAVLSQFLFLLLSISRLMAVMYPLTTRFKRSNFISQCLTCIFISSLVFALSLTLLTKFTVRTLPMNLCLPFLDPTNSIFIIKVITWFTVISQLLTFKFTSVMHILLVINIKKISYKYH